MTTVEAPTKMQLVSDGRSVRIDIEPQLNEKREGWIREEAPVFREVPATRSVLFRQREPSSGNPFTEINCADIHVGVEEIGLKLDEVNFAREMAEVLEAHGETVLFDPVIKPMEQSGYLFLGETALRP